MPKETTKKIADTSSAAPVFDACQLSTPLLGIINTEGDWKGCKTHLEDDKLRSLVQAVIASRGEKDNSCCCQCSEESKGSSGGNSKYIPVIIVPIYPMEKCPFDVDYDLKKDQELDKKLGDKRNASTVNTGKAKGEKKKEEKVTFTLQRLTDFDLLSQW